MPHVFYIRLDFSPANLFWLRGLQVVTKYYLLKVKPFPLNISRDSIHLLVTPYISFQWHPFHLPVYIHTYIHICMYIPSEVGGESQLVKKISVLSRFDFFFFFISYGVVINKNYNWERATFLYLSFKKKKKKEREKEQHCKWIRLILL